jgi:hypothetical protein
MAIDVKKVHPLFVEILDNFQAPHEDIKRNVPVVTRFMSNEEYMEYHESREELGYNEGYGRRWAR